MNTAEVVIAGGGVIGLSCALELALAGRRVTVLERGRAMGEASWAAAGMLAAEDPETPAELAALSALSIRLYPDYLAAIERLSGRALPLRTNNALQATAPGGAFTCTETETRVRISPSEAVQRVAGLDPSGRQFLWLMEASLDPRDLCCALPVAVQQAGVILLENTAVLAANTTGEGVTITSSSGEIRSDHFINCCGAWAGSIEQQQHVDPAESGHASPPEAVEPRKGQIAVVRLEAGPGGAKLQHVMRTPEIYLVPRGDDRIVIGATLERVGFDRQVQSGAVESLVQRAAEIWPPITRGPVVESWAGLRPGTRDDLPILGASPASSGTPRCWAATGHFRNGILLAPATALVLRLLIEGKSPGLALDAFSPDRFAAGFDLEAAS